YRIPANVVHIEEHFLESAWRPVEALGRVGHEGAAETMRQMHRYLHDPGTPDEALGEGLLDTLASGRLCLEDVLRSRSSWEAITEGYTRHCS
ncbi:DUF3492 domain-containing protein, partial [Salmonella enterica subsp. enterica]